MHIRFSIFRFLSCLTFILLSFSNKAQFNFEYNDEIIVKKGADTLFNAWSGGLDYVQISDFDYDFDGDLDLFIFDRSRDNIRVFTREIINGSPRWVIAHNATQKFPHDLIYRATMVDFDNDGKKDIFTYGIGGLKVYRNVGNAIDGIQWELFNEIVNSDYNGFYSNLYVASSDIPAIIDVDFDGDIDVLTFQQGGQHVEYHKNLSMEIYGIPDSLKFVLANECWGKFSENATNNNLVLNDPNVPCNGNGSLPNPEKANSKSTEKHAGSTLLALDYDNSGVMDLIIGDVAYNNLVLLLNGGTEPNTDSPMISADVNFPSNSLPANIYLFPAGFYVDVDFDGVKDLIVSASAKNVSENETSILFYKNTGSNALPNFNFQTKAFLQNKMIEHGKGSIPILFDVNNDGKKDLLVSNLYRFKSETLKESSVAYYQNTGSSNAPKFTFVDANFLSLADQNYGLRLVPTFGDLNGDGLQDMLLGNEFGTLIRYTNNGSTFINPTPNFQDNLGNVISVGNYSFPQLFDLDNDGLLDLIIGNRNGEITYYRNVGTSASASFQLITNSLGGIDVSTTSPDGYAAPHFMRINNETHLFVGNLDGTLRYYSNIDDSLATGGVFNLYNIQLLNLNVEGFSSFFVDDIDNDGFLNLFIGQDLGGLSLMEVDPNSSSSIPEISLLEAVIYPNPVTNSLIIEVQTQLETLLQINDLNGRVMHQTHFNTQTSLDVSEMESGIYLLRLTDTSGRSVVKKIIKK